MKQTRLTYQQKQWILDDFLSIVEDPVSYGYENLEGHMDEVLLDIQTDINQVFKCDIETSHILNTINSYEDKRQN